MQISYRILPFLTVLFAAKAALVQGAVVVNEIHYDPDVKTEHVEFVELYNSGTNTVDLSGWYFSSGPQFTFPQGTTIARGDYKVVAQDPAALLAKFGCAGALGPFTNRLSNGGEKLTLRNADGAKENEVEYGAGFPWPTVGDAPGYSIELIHPGLDNNLGGSWRASAGVGGPGATTNTLINSGETWSYVRGTNEASAPATLWRSLDFDDTNWETGAMPIGYDPTVPMGTPLNDMNGKYSTVFLRKKIVIGDASIYSSAFIEALYDDGFKVWINGTNVLNANISTNELPYYGTSSSTREDNSYNTLNLPAPAGYLVTGTNIIAIQLANTLLSNSSDCFLDLRLKLRTGGSGSGPTPGRRNSVYATNAPPQIRQVDHAPSQPKDGEVVKITAKVTDPDGVTNVVLQYQVVDPGNYIELTDAAYTNNWLSLPMRDTGMGGGLVAGDDIYSVELPVSLQTHRRLIRYRISATDALGASVQVPYADDPQPNFAYFVYNGIPEWRAALRPGFAGTNGTVTTYRSNEMARLQPIQLIARSNTVATATWFSRYTGDAYPWVGTLVYDGKVFDHIHFRARGGGWRYAMVKNMWKFDLNRGHDLEARDNWGRKFKTSWTKLNLGACIQQGDYGHRGEQGMFEGIGSRLFELTGVAGFKTAFATFRVIDDAQENPTANQYESDFWGLYLMVEQEDGHFLDEHGLPDGNLYKMEGGTGELNNLGPNGPTDKTDLNAFLSYGTAEAWWRTNLNLQSYYSYQAIVQAIHHYDIADGKNYFYYRNPETGLWQVVPWDLDLTWADNMYRSGLQGGDEPFKSRLLANFANPGTYSAIGIEFRNRVREIRDLLFNDEQAFQLVDEYARLLRGTNGWPCILDADRAQWDYNPKMANASYSSSPGKAGQGLFYQWPNEPAVPKSFDGAVQLMKNYINYRSTNATFSLDTISADALRPNRSTVTFTGQSNYPINRLTFRSSNFSGGGAFASMKWRIGEITDTNLASFDPTQPWKYEVTPVWESAELAAFNSDFTLPPAGLSVGHKYRVRVRMTDTTGRTSNWSLPVEFVAGQADGAADLLNYLRITEVMYSPPPGGYEFIELHNLSATNTLQLAGAKFTAGVDFTFPLGATIVPGGYLVVVGTTDLAGFRSYYGLDASVPVIGSWSGALANEGEQVAIKTSAGGMEIVSFGYSTGRGWPLTAKGTGHSLVLLESAEAAQGSGSGEYGGNWRASTYLKGSPGRAEVVLPPTVVLNEVVSHTDFLSEEDSNDWIELYNLTDAPLTLGPDWYLSDDGADLKKWMIPPATTLPARGWVSFDEQTGFHFPTNTGFGLSKDGEQVFLSYLPGTAEDRVVDWLGFKAQENDWSFGRYPDGTGPWYTLSPRTRDRANAAPVPGVVISEVCYHPPDIGGTNDNGLDEFIEIWNATPNPVELWNAVGNWRLSGAVDYAFQGMTLAPDEYLLVVHFDPAVNPAQLAAFRSLYGLTNQNVRIIGSYTGKLPNSSGRIALEKPQAPDIAGNPVSWVIVDEVLYADQEPWPAAADGSGASLQRLSAAAYGSDPGNWTAQSPSAGAATLVDSDRDGMSDWWENANGLNPLSPADAFIDSDSDGMNNLQEYLAGTNPRDPLSCLKLELPVFLPAIDSVVIRFNAVSNRSYTVQGKTGVAAGGWSNVASFDAQATNATVVLTNAVSPGGSSFYRLVTPRLP